ncbi:MAG: hypothetical protein IKY18_02075 [Oscillospiraceae bacterium]|nr:hypothetical protein [Oscillospiraceae bacterium]
MKSRTSFFNLTALRKNITRYWPVWALYTVFLLLVLFGISNQGPDYMARDVAMVITRLACIGNLLYAGVVTLCLFSDLYKSRLCNALHAFPMRREGWLLTNIATGFLFSLIPNLFVCTLASFQLGEYASFIWHLFDVAALQYIFFFGTAVLSALCAGNGLGMIAVYSIIQFVVVLIYFLAEVIYQPLIYGIELQTDKFYRFFPLYRMCTEYVKTEFGMSSLEFKGFDTAAWTHLYICAAVGVVAFVLAWLAYRRRHLERAGDFIALRPLAPVFLIVYTIAVGTVLYSFFAMIDQPSYVIYAIGIIIGFFTGQMLLNRTVRVFEKKSLLTFAVLAVVLSGSMALTWLDPMDIGGYVPSIEKVESAAIFGPDKTYYYHENEYDSFDYTNKEEIAALQNYHIKLMNARSRTNNNYDVRIRYKLTNGTEVNRYYQVDYKSSLTKEAALWYSDARYIFQVDDPQILYTLFSGCNIDKNYYDYDEMTGNEPIHYSTRDEELKGLLDAVLADCAAGKMGQAWVFHEGKASDYHISFSLDPKVYNENVDLDRHTSISVYSDCTNTIAYINEIYANLPEDYDNQRIG